jgi:hypothetical protein
MFQGRTVDENGLKHAKQVTKQENSHMKCLSRNYQNSQQNKKKIRTSKQHLNIRIID